MRATRTAISSDVAVNSRRAAREKFLLGIEKPRVSLLIPARNEERNLPFVLERVPADLHEVILIDGNSTDNTIAVAQEYYPSIHVIQQRANGKGSALITGMLAATGDIIVMIDADGSMDPIEIHVLTGALLSGADVVKSSRYLAGGGSCDISPLRDAGNRGLNIAGKVLFRHDWSELCYGYAAFWADIIPTLNLEPIVDSGDPTNRTRYGRGFEIETLLFTRAYKNGLKVAEVPSYEYSRRFGESNLNTFRDGWRVLTSLFRERFTDAGPSVKDQTRPVMVIGSGTEFLSGISHYTHHAALAFNEQDATAVVLMRRLVPRALYPGRKRVGNKDLHAITYPDSIPVFDGVDWHSPRSLLAARKFIQQSRPRVVILQWWTAAVAPQFLYLARAAAKTGAHVIIEFHEVQDVGESDIPLARSTARSVMRQLLKHTSGIIVHSSADKDAIRAAYPIDDHIHVAVIPVGPFQHITPTRTPRTRAPEEPLRLLFFGVIRPYKGLDVLVKAFERLIKQGENVELTVVGEPWSADDPSLKKLRSSAALRERVTIVDRFVRDEEIPGFLEEADVLVLPYRRSSASGPLALAMAAGMPVVTTALPSLMEVTDGYSGAVHVPVDNPAALAAGIEQAKDLVGETHETTLSWPSIVERYETFFDAIGVPNNPHRRDVS